MNNYTESLIKVRKILGNWDAVGKACGGLSGKAVMKWRDKGRPPRTEYTGETNYAKMLADATNNQVNESCLRPFAVKTKKDQSNAV